MGPEAEVRRELRLMGPFRVRYRGRTRPVPHSSARLLAAVALTGPLSRSHAAGLLWPDLPQPRAMANLRTALSRLSSVAPGFVEANGDVLSLAEDVHLDVDDVLAWVNSTIYEATESAVTGPPIDVGKELLPGWEEEWLTDWRERLRLLQAQALESAAERLIAAGRSAEALPYALAAVEAQPWSESANRLLIEIHARRGDASNALRRFHHFRATLMQELGVQPGPDVLAAIRQLYPYGTGGAAVASGPAERPRAPVQPVRPRT